LAIKLRFSELLPEALVHAFQLGPQGASIEFGRHGLAIDCLIENIGQHGVKELGAPLLILRRRHQDLRKKGQRQPSLGHDLVGLLNDFGWIIGHHSTPR